MLYILLALALFFISIQIYRLWEMRKHDQHLFEFCQLRRDTITYLSNSYESLSRTDYIALRKINDALSTIIAEYKEHRTVVFNFRLFVEYLDELKAFEKKAEKISTSNKEIQNLLNRIHCSIFKAFLAFTPYLKSELALSLVMKLSSLGVKAGVNSLKGYLSSLKEAKMMVNTFKRSSTPC
ncbi:hypothetical protein Misp06_03411 [Microbulbifer sp. NBRC 101763]|uniref:hypothetical protein n=2 Tax=Microbulbiferaceae TaxID=1706373 RepID=UPI00036D33AA|nr:MULTISPECIES: hypothetical protein [Microbulbifer]WHI52792.1 hypothetical protein P3339_08525 [Microbulbifer sp. MLAF003]